MGTTSAFWAGKANVTDLWGQMWQDPGRDGEGVSEWSWPEVCDVWRPHMTSPAKKKHIFSVDCSSAPAHPFSLPLHGTLSIWLWHSFHITHVKSLFIRKCGWYQHVHFSSPLALFLICMGAVFNTDHFHKRVRKWPSVTAIKRGGVLFPPPGSRLLWNSLSVLPAFRGRWFWMASV